MIPEFFTHFVIIIAKCKKCVSVWTNSMKTNCFLSQHKTINIKGTKYVNEHSFLGAIMLAKALTSPNCRPKNFITILKFQNCKTVVKNLH